MLNKSELYKGWYKGKGRNANIAYWTGSTFLTIGKNFDEYVIKDEGYYEEKGFGCFQPEQRISKTKIESLSELTDDREIEEFGDANID